MSPTRLTTALEQVPRHLFFPEGAEQAFPNEEPVPLRDGRSEQLDLGGRLVIALGDVNTQLIERMRKRSDGLDSETIGACQLDLLPTPRRIPSVFPWAGHRGR